MDAILKWRNKTKMSLMVAVLRHSIMQNFNLEENIDLKINQEDVDEWIFNKISLKNDDERKFHGVKE